MKKTYVAPETVNIGLMAEPVMNVTSGEQDIAGTGSGTAGNGNRPLSSGNRGDWGNLWN